MIRFVTIPVCDCDTNRQMDGWKCYDYSISSKTLKLECIAMSNATVGHPLPYGMTSQNWDVLSKNWQFQERPFLDVR